MGTTNPGLFTDRRARPTRGPGAEGPFGRGGRRSSRRVRQADAVAIGGILILALNVLDAVTTRFALGLGGTEANPLMEPFIDHLPLFLTVKIGFPALVAWWLWRRRWEATPVLVTAVYLLVAVYGVVVVVNLSHLL